MEKNEDNKRKVDMKEMMLNSSQLFKKNIILFILISLLCTVAYFYFSGSTIDDLLSTKVFIGIVPFAMSMFILFMTCVLSDAACIICNLLKTIVDEISGNKEESLIKKVIIFTALMLFFEFIFNLLSETMSVNSTFTFVIMSIGSFVACYFAMNKTFS
ncbi:hypothetical protein [Clostridium sp.]|uniref:hypothetical protein n=1 Tax=Clostridium sp. TaxID=1506 RepID=UPI002FC887C9